MSAESYLELFTAFFGWRQYNNLWSILTETGLAYVPFALLIVRNFVSAASEMAHREAGLASLRRLEVDLVLAFSVVVLAAQPSPLTPLNPALVKFEDPCTGKSVGATASGTTYDATMGSVVTATDVPAWWYGVIALSGGVTHAAVAGLGCVDDYSGYRLDIADTRIEDPALQQELTDFLQACFIPARSRYYRERPDVGALLTSHGDSDPDWFGSYVYMETPGYYDFFHAERPVKGWPLELSGRDAEYDHPNLPKPASGRPLCKEWYEHPRRGLRAKLLAEIPPPLMARANVIRSSLGFGSYTHRNMEDDTLRTLATASLAAAPASSDVSTTYGDGILALVGAGLGTAWEQVSFTPMMYAVKSGAPIVQALLLAGIYTLLPLALIFSNYSWTMVFTATIGIVAIKFWSYLWHTARWLEDNLTAAMYPDGTTFFSGAGIANMTDPTFALKTMLLEMATASLFIGLPLLFSLVVAWGGSRALVFMSSAVSSLHSPLQRAGAAGGRIAQQTVGQGVARRR